MSRATPTYQVVTKNGARNWFSYLQNKIEKRKQVTRCVPDFYLRGTKHETQFGYQLSYWKAFTVFCFSRWILG